LGERQTGVGLLFFVFTIRIRPPSTSTPVESTPARQSFSVVLEQLPAEKGAKSGGVYVFPPADHQFFNARRPAAVRGGAPV
jgi:hypothetical protein